MISSVWPFGWVRTNLFFFLVQSDSISNRTDPTRPDETKTQNPVLEARTPPELAQGSGSGLGSGSGSDRSLMTRTKPVDTKIHCSNSRFFFFFLLRVEHSNWTFASTIVIPCLIQPVERKNPNPNSFQFFRTKKRMLHLVERRIWFSILFDP
jgi:hypothetical protein